MGTKVNLKDAAGKTATADVAANGFYSIAVDGLTAPFIMNAGGFYSFAEGPGVTNINPFTHLSMQIALGIAVIDGTTVIPAGFHTQFAAAVADLKAKTDALYPTSVAATQKDFLNGNITIAVGVDKVFDSAAITVPDASGSFTVTVSGLQILSGTRSNGVTTLAPNTVNIVIVTNTVFPVISSATFTSSMVSGKSFTWTTSGSGDTGTAVFNADGTMIRTKNGAAQASGTWSINVHGVMTMVVASIGEVDVLVLTSSTASSFTALDGWANGINNTSGTNTMTFTVGGGPAPVNMFTASMISGNTFNSSDTNGNTGVGTFNANGTMTGTNTGTWVINASGQLVLTVSDGNVATFTLTGVAGTVYTASESVSNGNKATMTFTQMSAPVVSNGFTTAMVSGKSFNFITSSGGVGTTAFNPNGTFTISGIGGTLPGTWSINASGKLIETFSARGEVDTCTLTGSSATTLVISDSYNVSGTIGLLNMTFTATN